ncbi:MAG: hypothetical protein OEU92_25730 [Alphaproteobacteria bacterium]|nr:hypothetical protein [Alphaproteobacteria bacterium]
MSIHRYPLSSLLFDGLRTAFGLAATFGPLLALDVVRPLALILAGLGAVFLVFALKLAEQGLSSIELSDDGISRRGPMARRLAWRGVTSLKLAHYAAPRRPSDGWYQLTLTGDGGVLKVDSTIDGFSGIVAAAVEAAEASDVAFDPVTGENLKAFGLGAGRRAVFG